MLLLESNSFFLKKPTCGSTGGFTGGLGTFGKVMFQLYMGLLTFAHPSPMEQRSVVFTGATLMIFNTDILYRK